MRTIERDARALRERLLGLARRRSLRDPVAASCETLGLTAPQIHALLWLGHDGPLTMGELARRVAVTEKTVTGIVDRLERDGLVRRERDAEDRRVVRARATGRGEAVSRDIEEGVHGKLVRLLALLDARDRRALVGILERLLARLDEAPGRPAEPARARRRPRRSGHAGAPSRGRREET
ncbi:MAG TPA: MarR family transcriptional regulator [Anaeromyxobacter sp.]|nr:MarR family transcriptional regulator [Anaeromyxobacter sp.]